MLVVGFGFRGGLANVKESRSCLLYGRHALVASTRRHRERGHFLMDAC